MQFTAFEQAKISAQVAELVGLAEGFIKAGRVGEARDILETVDAVAPGNFAVLRLLGIVCATLGDHAAGARAMTAALALRDDALAHNVLSVCCYALGEFDEALAAADAALQLDPGFTAAYVNLGNALQEDAGSQESKAGEDSFRQALKLQEQLVRDHADVADYRWDLGKTLDRLALLFLHLKGARQRPTAWRGGWKFPRRTRRGSSATTSRAIRGC